jgi:hypothetical protein
MEERMGRVYLFTFFECWEMVTEGSGDGWSQDEDGEEGENGRMRE